VMLQFLADSSASDNDKAMQAVWAGIGILVGVSLLMMSVRWMKKRFVQQDIGTASTGFTISDLRRLVKEGKMTQEEFDRARARVLEAHKRSMEIKPALPDSVSKKQPPPATTKE
jgi:hypothetical protein